MALWSVLLLLAACTGGGDSGGPAADSAGETGGDPDDPADEPVVRAVDAVCAADAWTVTAQVDDPQGVATVVAGEVVVARDGVDLHRAPLTCDGLGTCSGGFGAAEAGAACAEAGNHIFRFTVTDEDGHVADAFGCQGRAG